jgi:hypothetical protein
MKRGTLIIGLFVIIVALVIGANYLFRSQPPLELRLAVDPLAEDWARQAVTEFNAGDTRVNGRQIRLNVVSVSDLNAWRQRALAGTSRADLWLPASSATVAYAVAGGLPVRTLVDSLAMTPLISGVYTSRAAVLTGQGAQPLDWAAVAQAAAAERWDAIGGDSGWNFVKLAFPLPNQTMTGLAVLFSGAAAYHDTAALSGRQLADTGFRAWLAPVIASVSNFNTIGNSVPAFMLRSGTAAADLGFAPESQWLVNLDNFGTGDALVLHYPDYTFVFDFPLAIWDDPAVTDEVRAAGRAFADWMAAPARQATAAAYGLRPPDGLVAPDAALFTAAAASGVPAGYAPENVIQPPANTTDVQSLISWFEDVSR